MRSQNRFWGEGGWRGSMSINKGLRTHLSPQSWARGIWRGMLFSALFSFSLHSLLIIFLLFGFSFLLCSSPQLFSLLPFAGCHNQPCLALSLRFSPLPPTPSSPALGTPSPWGEVGGERFDGPPPIPLLASGGPLPTPPKKHLKFLMECIPVLSENLRRGLILGNIKGQASTFIIFGHYV